MSNTNLLDSLKRELKEMEASEILSPAYRRKKLIAYAVRTAIMVALYILFWQYVWLRWTLLVYVPLNLVGLVLILGAERFVRKKMEQTRQQIEEINRE
ncbi:MAG: hypothetical protein R3E32_16400 [Chitinophagales bacterium]